jgi:hypothetical protein
MREPVLYSSYQSFLYPFKLQDPLSLYVQRVGGWFSTRPDSVIYTVPQETAYMLYLFDPHLRACPHMNYIV